MYEPQLDDIMPFIPAQCLAQESRNIRKVGPDSREVYASGCDVGTLEDLPGYSPAVRKYQNPLAHIQSLQRNRGYTCLHCAKCPIMGLAHMGYSGAFRSKVYFCDQCFNAGHHVGISPVTLELSVAMPPSVEKDYRIDLVLGKALSHFGGSQKPRVSMEAHLGRKTIMWLTSATGYTVPQLESMLQTFSLVATDLVMTKSQFTKYFYYFLPQGYSSIVDVILDRLWHYIVHPKRGQLEFPFYMYRLALITHDSDAFILRSCCEFLGDEVGVEILTALYSFDTLWKRCGAENSMAEFEVTPSQVVKDVLDMQEEITSYGQLLVNHGAYFPETPRQPTCGNIHIKDNSEPMCGIDFPDEQVPMVSDSAESNVAASRSKNPKAKRAKSSDLKRRASDSGRAMMVGVTADALGEITHRHRAMELMCIHDVEDYNHITPSEMKTILFADERLHKAIHQAVNFLNLAPFRQAVHTDSSTAPDPLIHASTF
eukprot:scpid58382/ scgid27320/ 